MVGLSVGRTTLCIYCQPQFNLLIGQTFCHELALPLRMTNSQVLKIVGVLPYWLSCTSPSKFGPLKCLDFRVSISVQYRHSKAHIIISMWLDHNLAQGCDKKGAALAIASCPFVLGFHTTENMPSCQSHYCFYGCLVYEDTFSTICLLDMTVVKGGDSCWLRYLIQEFDSNDCFIFPKEIFSLSLASLL